MTFNPLVYENVCMIIWTFFKLIQFHLNNTANLRLLTQLACRQRVLSDIAVKNIFSEFYPQGGGESQLASKLRHCHPMYTHKMAILS